MDIEKVGRAISYLRKRAGYTQKDLASRIGISDKAVSKWERGLSLPDVAYLRKLSILLNTDSDSLLAGAPVYHNSKWRGIIVLEKNQYGIDGGTIVYDKPLVYFLLSYFLLVGIRNITILCADLEEAEIRKAIGDGSDYGITLKFRSDAGKQITAETDDGNIMLVYGRCLLYGVDQTRFFQKAMSDRNKLTVLALPKRDDHSPLRVTIDASKRIVNANPDEPLKLQYDYCALPILFFPESLLPIVLEKGDIASFVSEYAEKDDVFVELLDRGFVEFELDTWDSVQEASTFIKIIQDRCGMNVYCLEEVAWRRGLITLAQLRKLTKGYEGTKYGAYLDGLYECYKNTEILEE